jgi:hypothetical protein
MHAHMECFQNALAYFATDIRYIRISLLNQHQGVCMNIMDS